MAKPNKWLFAATKKFAHEKKKKEEEEVDFLWKRV